MEKPENKKYEFVITIITNDVTGATEPELTPEDTELLKELTEKPKADEPDRPKVVTVNVIRL